MFIEFSQATPVIFGCGAISILGEKIKERGCKKAIIICEKGIEDAGIVAKAIASLDAAGIAHAVFSGVLADPPDSVVDEAGEFALREGVDCIIGLGGGSSLDTSKSTAILMSNPGPIRKYINQTPMFVNISTPLFLIPTTAGTGSECTTVSVITLPDKNVKWSVFVNPTLALVDPELMLSLPKSITASTGMDALSHAIESITNLNCNPHSDLYAEAAIKKISSNLLTCCDSPGNVGARSEMALAANWAGMAFNITICHVGHAIADALSCNFHTPHGLNCALALPATIDLVAQAVPERVRTVALAMGLPLSGGESAGKLGQITADGIRALMRSIGIPSLKEMGFPRETVVGAVDHVLANFLSTFCPVKIDKNTAGKLLAAVYDTYQ